MRLARSTRLFNRFRSHLLVKVTDEHGTELTNICDFSVSGVSFTLGHQVTPDTSLTLLLNGYMPNATRQIAVDAKVAWAASGGASRTLPGRS